MTSPMEPDPPRSEACELCHAVSCCATSTSRQRIPGFSLPAGMCCGLVWVFSFTFFFYFSSICFSNNVTHPEQDVCILHSPCSSALFPSGRCLPALGDYLSESSRCRAAGITHGVRFEKGGERLESVLCLQLFISHSLIYFFSLLSFFSCQCSPSWLPELPPPCSYTRATASCRNPVGCQSALTVLSHGCKGVPMPSHPAGKTSPLPSGPPSSHAAHHHQLCLLRSCPFSLTLGPILSLSLPQHPHVPPWHKPLCPIQTRAHPNISPLLPP